MTMSTGKVSNSVIRCEHVTATGIALTGKPGCTSSPAFDTIEDTETSEQELVRVFGQDIAAVTQESLRKVIGMVPQDDVVHGQLTVRQALMYAAELRLPVPGYGTILLLGSQ